MLERASLAEEQFCWSVQGEHCCVLSSSRYWKKPGPHVEYAEYGSYDMYEYTENPCKNTDGLSKVGKVCTYLKRTMTMPLPPLLLLPPPEPVFGAPANPASPPSLETFVKLAMVALPPLPEGAPPPPPPKASKNPRMLKMSGAPPCPPPPDDDDDPSEPGPPMPPPPPPEFTKDDS
jgi:hypothetical protein